MHRAQTLLIFFLSAGLLSACSPQSPNTECRTILPNASSSAAPRATAIASAEPNAPMPETDFTARFEIYTLGTKRIFTDRKYHNQSESVYISNPDPHIVRVKAPGITWSDFFATLPFSVNKDCLVTGTKQTFCTNATNTLRFFLDGVETPNALDLPIQPGTILRVEYI